MLWMTDTLAGEITISNKSRAQKIVIEKKWCIRRLLTKEVFLKSGNERVINIFIKINFCSE